MTRKIAPILHEIVTAIDGAIEIISEASRHVPAQLKAMHPNIRWRSIAGIGNVLRHEYHAISDQVIWKVIQNELPPLKATVTTIKAAIKE
jgi:uncharacterized protein with HEPN domain